MVYNAMRVAQGEVAATAGIDPEEISPAKFYPRMAAACHMYVTAQQWEQEVRELNPRRGLRLPDWSQQPWASIPLTPIRVEERRGRRRTRRYCKSRGRWKSLARASGGRRYTRLT